MRPSNFLGLAAGRCHTNIVSSQAKPCALLRRLSASTQLRHLLFLASFHILYQWLSGSLSIHPGCHLDNIRLRIADHEVAYNYTIKSHRRDNSLAWARDGRHPSSLRPTAPIQGHQVGARLQRSAPLG